ncbi:MAG TPA: DEAD/DEAH box helicase [Tepidisphaeraceae bacterium]
MIDPFEMWRSLTGSYHSYLSETFPVHASQPRLRELLHSAIRRENALCKPPLVSIIPAYAPADSPSQLFGNKAPPRLDPQLKRLSPREFDPDRPLYRHQVDAIKRIQLGRNAVVATGTGSGKTEAFLFPILDHCIRTRLNGVQAILIYPMNALANDQLDRLRLLLGDSGITIGRYTGQTPENEEDLDEDTRQNARPFERATRDQIRRELPQILLTNFAMLEYLLLRPSDQTIFKDDTVKFVVLDEAHSYRGSQGIDISLLMKRLQLRFSHKLQFILTSATLGDPKDPGNRERIAKYAGELSGAEFAPDDVVDGYVVDPFERVPRKELTPDSVGRLAKLPASRVVEAMASKERTQSLLRETGIPVEGGEAGVDVLYASLRRLEPLHRFYRRLRAGAATIDELARELRGPEPSSSADESALHATNSLLAAASLAIPSDGRTAPLLAVRLHHFFRGFGGASVLLESIHKVLIVKKLYLERKAVDDVPDPETGEEPTGRALLALFTCTHCGMPVVGVERDRDHWKTPLANRPQSELDLLTWLDLEQLGNDEEVEDGDGFDPNYMYLCTEESCRAVGEGTPAACGHSGQLRLLRLPSADAQGLRRCPCCNGERRPYPSVLRDFVVGEDAPTALLAEEILRCLPEQPNCGAKPAGGRQLIAFSDARQRAAFFYPYLARTSCEPAYVQPLIAAVRQLEDDSDVTSPKRVVEAATQIVVNQPRVLVRRIEGDVEYYDHLTKKPTSEDLAEIRESLAAILYEQLGATGRMRTKLPGLSLVGTRFDVDNEAFAEARGKMPELFADEQVGRDLVSRLLHTLIRTQAVEFWPNQVDRRKILGLAEGPTLVTVHRGARAVADGHQMLQWNSVTRSARGWIIRRALGLQDGVAAADAVATEALDEIWDWMLDAGILEEHYQHPGEFRLPAKRILATTQGPWFRCDRCGAVTLHLMNGTCEMRGCKGSLHAVAADALRQEHAQSHRVKRFVQKPLPLAVLEHTAQISLSEGKRIQRDFMNKDVNVLSSSTTFEMGVDVGQLEAVLLRNVPPTAASYVQRAGRAGRRRVGAAHAVSYARLMPHDQHHFHRPFEIVGGSVPVPVVYPKNERLTQRHINALLLSAFLAHHRLPVDDPRLQDFFPVSEAAADGTSAAERYVRWCQTLPPAVRGDVGQLASRAQMDSDAAINASASSMFQPSGPCVWRRGLLDPLGSFEKERRRLTDEKTELERERKSRQAAAVFAKLTRIDSLISQQLGEGLIGTLSSCSWLPAYAFPQDAVRLLVLDPNYQSALKLERDRESGISEYAPQSEIIADGKMFTSIGINLLGRAPDIRRFRFCEATRRVRLGLDGDELKRQLPSLGHRPPKSGQFVLPAGFLTSIDDKGRQPNLYRLRPPSNSELFVVDSLDESEFEMHQKLPGVATGICRNAQLFTANLGRSGQGFCLCVSCGSASDGMRMETAHDRPFGGAKCKGRQERVALASIFHTDVLQVRFPAVSTPSVIGDVGRTFWTTLAAAVATAACELHRIDPSDLEVSYRSISDADHRGELLLFDNVPGGAGFVQRIRYDLPAVLSAAMRVLQDCPNTIDCGMQSSCYACLRTYRNQFDWQFLCREAPLPWLASLCR